MDVVWVSWGDFEEVAEWEDDLWHQEIDQNDDSEDLENMSESPEHAHWSSGD